MILQDGCKRIGPVRLLCERANHVTFPSQRDNRAKTPLVVDLLVLETSVTTGSTFCPFQPDRFEADKLDTGLRLEMTSRVLTLLLVAALALPFASCRNDAAPLPNPGPSDPDGRGGDKLFRPPIDHPPIGRTGPDKNGKERNDGNQGRDKIDNLKTDNKGGPGPHSPVPEPGTLFVVGAGLAGVAVYRRRRRDAVESEHEATQ